MRRRAAGFTYLGLLFVISLMGLLAALAGSSWTFVAQRDQERELLFAGRAYRQAIEHYRATHASQRQPYPTELAQLLGGTGELVKTRHLRRLYADPITGSLAWGLVKTPQGGIVGVYSLSERAPLRTRGVYAGEAIDFEKAKTYRDWIFAAANPAPAPPAANTPGQPGVGGDADDQGAPPLQWTTPPAPPEPD